jgi:major membrane immunogen (membrane-anchored lipoprotein)
MAERAPRAAGSAGGRGAAHGGRLGGAAASVGALIALAGCGSDAPEFDESIPLTDGVFIGESAPDEQGAYGRSTVTVEGGKIVGSEYVTVQANGSVKAEDYGKDSDGEIGNPASYRAAQKAVAAFDVYARDLLEVGVPADVEVVSGATIAHGQFLDAATKALKASQDGRPATPTESSSGASSQSASPGAGG